ncbi:MAG: hypothetical protein K0S70_5137 [Microbacterium sp.]|nr:hypothetical protein [Microbacterium sp.]
MILREGDSGVLLGRGERDRSDARRDAAVDHDRVFVDADEVARLRPAVGTEEHDPDRRQDDDEAGEPGDPAATCAAAVLLDQLLEELRGRLEVRGLVRGLASRMQPAAALRASGGHLDTERVRRRPHDRRRSAEQRVLASDVDDDDRDVIGRTAVEGLLEEAVGRAARSPALPERLRGVGVVDDARQSVGAQQPPVAGLRGHDERVDLGIGVHVAEHTHEHRAARVVASFLRGDAARVDQTLHERVVRRDLGQRPVAEEVQARVADVRDDGVLVDHDERADGRAHAGELGAHLDGADQLCRGVGQRLAQGGLGLGGRGEGLVEALEPSNREARGDVATGMPAHAVGDDEQVRTAEARVLVVGAHLPGMRDGGAGALKDHTCGLLPQFERRRADLDRRTHDDRNRRSDALAVVPRAVGRVEILDHPLVAPQHQTRVVARRVVVADDEA